LPFLDQRWEVEPPVDGSVLARFPKKPPLLVQLLHNRQLSDPEVAEAFFDAQARGPSPFLLKGMHRAVARLRQAIRGCERIAVYGDFDTDGVTATALLVQTLSSLGAHVVPYIPHRVKEGYGLNLDALRRLYKEGVRVVVTVDCGIRSVQEVKAASRGLDMIVTDHHTVAEQVPPALAVINPKQPGCSYPYDNLAGVGLAFKLAQALLLTYQRSGSEVSVTEEQLVDLVALGTVADLAPLRDENRVLVQKGLVALNQRTRPGIEALMADAGLRRGGIDATAIGFRLGPRLNAAGRLDDAMLAFHLLTNTDRLASKELANKLGLLNRRRQEMTERAVEEAKAQIEASEPDAYLHLAASEEYRAGIVGLVASRLAEAYYRPSIVVELGEKESRGSCRSIPAFNITEALTTCKDILIRFGGHVAAAGFTVETKNLEALRHRLQAYAAEKLKDADLQPVLRIDADIPLEDVSWDTLALLSQLEPCGVENPQPVLMSRAVQVRDVRTMGQGRHLRLKLRDGRGAIQDAVAFRRGDQAGLVAGRVDLAYRLEANEWQGERRLQLNVQDLRPAQQSRTSSWS
jgi:single-stranded-DNA-specific exonuclease